MTLTWVSTAELRWTPASQLELLQNILAQPESKCNAKGTKPGSNTGQLAGRTCQSQGCPGSCKSFGSQEYAEWAVACQDVSVPLSELLRAQCMTTWQNIRSKHVKTATTWRSCINEAAPPNAPPGHDEMCRSDPFSMYSRLPYCFTVSTVQDQSGRLPCSVRKTCGWLPADVLVSGLAHMRVCVCVCHLNRCKTSNFAGGHRGPGGVGDQRRHLPGTRVNVPAGLWCTWAHLSRSWWPPQSHIYIYNFHFPC